MPLSPSEFFLFLRMAFPLRLQKELRNNELIMNEWRHQVNEDMYDRCSCYWWVSKVGGNFPHLSACSLGIGFIQELDSVQVSWTLLASSLAEGPLGAPSPDCRASWPDQDRGGPLGCLCREPPFPAGRQSPCRLSSLSSVACTVITQL